MKENTIISVQYKETMRYRIAVESPYYFGMFHCGTYKLLRRKVQQHLLSKYFPSIILFEVIDYIISGVDKKLEADGLESIV